MKILEGKSITAVQGIKAAGITAGIKRAEEKMCALFTVRKKLWDQRCLQQIR